MKFIIVALAFMACAYADVSELGYNYEQPHAAQLPVQQPHNTYIPPPSVPAQASLPIEQPKNTYIPPPSAAQASLPIEQPRNTYIPPPQQAQASLPIEQPQNTYIPPATGEDIEGLAQDGYRYKTVRRVVYRHRA